MGTGTALALALLIAGALVAVHLAAPRMRRIPGVPERVVASAAGGIAVSYVFLHLLPELVEGNESIGRLLEDRVDPTPLLDLAIFTVALAGFAAFYGLERLARRAGDESPGIFRLHLGAFAVYNALITYTMPLRLRTGAGFAVLFSVAMALHFVLTDRGLSRHYPRRFARSGRAVLAGALVLGWAAAAVAAPTRTEVVAFLTALLGGSILLNVFKEELPEGAGSSYPWFLGGLAVYGALLAVVTSMAG
ncbi:MAG: hypothetical protein U0237_02965 [Thermoleophilia bacterium]